MHQYKFPMQGIENSEINLMAISQQGVLTDILKTFKSQLICIVTTKSIHFEEVKFIFFTRNIKFLGLIFLDVIFCEMLLSFDL